MSKIDHLTLYHYPLSRSARVRFMLEEIGCEYDLHSMKMMQGEGMSPEHLARNPNHAVPVLEVRHADGSEQTIIESGAILLWLAEAYPDAGLAPEASDLTARADYLSQMLFQAAHLDMSLWQIRLNETLFPKTVRSAAIAAFNRDKITNEMVPQMEARLGEHDFICGDRFTAVDCIAAQNVNWMHSYGLVPVGPIKHYAKRMRSRPAFQRAFADAADFER